MDHYADRFSALLGGVVTEEPIRTSPEAERVLDSILPVEANAREQVAELRRYVDSQFAVVNSNIAARFGRAIAPTLRWAKRMVRARGRV